MFKNFVYFATGFRNLSMLREQRDRTKRDRNQPRRPELRSGRGRGRRILCRPAVRRSRNAVRALEAKHDPVVAGLGHDQVQFFFQISEIFKNNSKQQMKNIVMSNVKT